MEFELTSSSFRVDPEGFLLVDEAGLDRDPPSQETLSFQVLHSTARR